MKTGGGGEGLLDGVGPAAASNPSLGSWEVTGQILGGPGWWLWWEGDHIVSLEWCPGAKWYRPRVAGSPRIR